MPKVTLTEHIDAPVEEVFAYLTDPINELEWVSSAREREIVAGEGVRRESASSTAPSRAARATSCATAGCARG